MVSKMVDIEAMVNVQQIVKIDIHMVVHACFQRSEVDACCEQYCQYVSQQDFLNRP